MKQAYKKGYRNQIGAIGEEITAHHLSISGYQVIEKNYLKPWGEIDIVARENDQMVFVEVKTVSYETKIDLDNAVTRETWRSEDKIHKEKLKRLGRAIQTWIASHGYMGTWRFLIAIVQIVPREKLSVINLIEEVILE